MNIESLLPNIIGGIVGGLIQSPTVPQITERDKPALNVVVEKQIDKEIGPVLEHLTNNEPWYQSRVTLGSAAALIAAGAAAFGRNWNAATVTEYLVTAGSLIGPLVALYGRWAARKPLGA